MKRKKKFSHWHEMKNSKSLNDFMEKEEEE